MELKIEDILDNIKILKSCINCHVINHINNRECVVCGNKSFDYREEAISNSYEEELNYYVNEEGYSFTEARNIVLEI